MSGKLRPPRPDPVDAIAKARIFSLPEKFWEMLVDEHMTLSENPAPGNINKYKQFDYLIDGIEFYAKNEQFDN